MGHNDRGPVTVLAVGDVGFERREDPASIFRYCGATLAKADITVAQLEGPISEEFEPVLSPQGGRCMPSETVMGLTSAGIDVISLASNHAVDAGHKALLNTIEILRKHNIATVGAGANLREARKPAILERNGTRIAFLAYCSVMPVGFEADDDRPGVAPLRAFTAYEPLDYQPGTPPRIRTWCHPPDLANVLDDVRAAKNLADTVIVISHSGVHLVPALIADYQKEAAHAAIDAGADQVICHHAHILKGIELYRGKCIFYGLGDFAMEHTTARKRNAMEPRWDTKTKPGGIYWWFRTDEPGWEKHPVPPEARHTMVAKTVIEDGLIKDVSFLPAVHTPNIDPEILKRDDPRGEAVKAYVNRISKEMALGTQFVWDGDEVLIRA